MTLTVEIILGYTFHYPGNFDDFLHDLQNQIEDVTNILANFNLKNFKKYQNHPMKLIFATLYR